MAGRPVQPRRRLRHLAVLVALVVFGAVAATAVAAVAASRNKSFIENQCLEAIPDSSAPIGVMSVSRSWFPPQIVCDYGNGMETSVPDWLNLVGFPVLICFAVVLGLGIRYVDRRLLAASLRF